LSFLSSPLSTGRPHAIPLVQGGARKRVTATTKGWRSRYGHYSLICMRDTRLTVATRCINSTLVNSDKHPATSSGSCIRRWIVVRGAWAGISMGVLTVALVCASLSRSHNNRRSRNLEAIETAEDIYGKSSPGNDSSSNPVLFVEFKHTTPSRKFWWCFLAIIILWPIPPSFLMTPTSAARSFVRSFGQHQLHLSPPTSTISH